VICAEDGAQAMGLYALHRAEIAVVLTDIMMPVMDGVVLSTALRRIDPAVRIITASGLAGNETRATGGGVKHFLAKPYSTEAMLEMIKRVLAEGGGNSTGE
jgi:YesN/AraC family two-component response regulator